MSRTKSTTTQLKHKKTSEESYRVRVNYHRTLFKQELPRIEEVKHLVHLLGIHFLEKILD